MRRFSFVLCAWLTLTACSRPCTREATAVVANEVYPAGTSVNVTLDNRSGRDLDVTAHVLEREEGGHFVALWPASSADAWLAPGQHLELNLNERIVPACRAMRLTVRLPDDIPPGRYRLRWGKLTSNMFSVAAEAPGR